MTIERLLEALDQLVAHASEIVDSDQLAKSAQLVRHGRRRIGFLGDGLVVALAGGTGSGKSSLLNAIAGSKVTESGPIRPTTSQALAWAPVTPEPGIVRLLEDMGIETIVTHSEFPNLTILDMPDTDSVVGAHRALFQELLPRVDAVVWVVDPEKYNDRLLHDHYLAPLAAYSDQFVFVMNQIDRLSSAELETVLDDFDHRLRVDGIVDPLVVATAADPIDGPPIGIEHLMEELSTRLDAKQLVVEKVAIDARRVAADLADAAGLGGGPIGFDDRWDATRQRAVDVLSELVAGTEVEEVATRVGRAEAMRKAAGPLGALSDSVKDSPVGRLLGFQQSAVALEASTANWNHRAGLEAVYALIERFVGDVASDLGGRHAVKLRTALPGEETTEGIQRIVDRSLVGYQFPDVRAAIPNWLRVFGVLKWAFAGTFIAGAIWLWAVPVQRGEWPWPIILMLGALVLGLGASRLAEGIGARGGRVLTRRFRAAISQDLGVGLDREFGIVMRTHVRDKAVLAAQVEEVGQLAEATLAQMDWVDA